jgi:hypothetical protein
MRCPNCHTEHQERDIYCRQCGAELEAVSRSLVTTSNTLPAVLYNSPVPRSVAAGVGALALGVGIELLRRNLLTRLGAPRQRRLPSVAGVKDLLFPQQQKPVKLPRGYEVHETVIYMQRVIRRSR